MGKSKKLDITKDLLEEMYQSMTMQQIAEELGVSYKTIQRRFREYGLGKKKVKKLKRKKKVIGYKNKEEFQKVYEKYKSLALVAKHYNVSIDTAHYWKKKHNIETIKGVSEYSKSLANLNKPYTNKEWLEERYKTMTLKEIADSLGVNVCTIQEWGKRLGLKTRSVAEQRALKSGHGNRTVYSCYHKKFSKDNYLAFLPNALNKQVKRIILTTIPYCQCCGYSEVLDIHHIDEDKHNNEPHNHVVLCPNCHAKIHRLGKTVEELVPDYESWIDKL